MRISSRISKMTGMIIVTFLSILVIMPVQTFAAPPTQDGNSPLVDQTWVRLGGPVGGIGYDIRMDPISPNIMYVTDAWAGVHKSLDGGLTWFPINNGINLRTGPSGDAIPVFSLTIDPHNTNTLWVGLQGFKGIYRSNDGGQTWELKVNGIKERGITFRGFSVDPNDSNIVYAAAEIPSFEWAGKRVRGDRFDRTQGRVFRTINSGESWELIWSGDNLARYVWIDPRNTNVLYISTGIFDREAANTKPEEAEPGGVGIYKSTDGGKTWRELGISEGLTGLYVGSLYMNPDNPDVLLAGVGSDAWSWIRAGIRLSDAGIFLSENAGESWKKVQDGPIISAIEFCSDVSIAYAAGEIGFYRSIDGGHTWKKTTSDSWGSPGKYAGIPIDIQCDPRDPMRVFVNSYNGGNIYSQDGGNSWIVASQGISGAQIRQVSIDPNNPALLYATSLDGVSRSQNGGGSWEYLNFGPIKGQGWFSGILLNPFDPNNIILSGVAMDKIYQSLDGGYTWNMRFSTDQGQPVPGFVDFAQSPSDPSIIFAAARVNWQSEGGDRFSKSLGIYKSTDTGKTWKIVNTGLSEDLNINRIAVHPTNPDIVWAGTSNDGLYKTLDGGNNWGKVNNGIGSNDIRGLAISPVLSDMIIAGTIDAGIYLTRDAGITWIKSSKGMAPEEPIVDILFDPGNPQVIWAASTLSGVFISQDNGMTWSVHNYGLDVKSTNSLAISSDGQTLYAGTEGGGVFRLSTHDQSYFDSLAPTPTAIPPTVVPTNLATESPIATLTPVLPVSTKLPTSTPVAPEPSMNVMYVGGAIVLLLLLVALIQWRRQAKGK